MAISTATGTLAHAIARPTPITDEPTYNGCADHRYGPETVTSRDFCRWPAAQKRIASPTADTVMPAATDARLGCARISTSAPNTKPSATRNRASPATSTPRKRSDTSRSRVEAPLDRVEHLLHLDIEQTHAAQSAPAQMMALTHGVARHDQIVGRHRPVARRARRSVDADERRADGAGDMRRSGVARHHYRRAPG